MTAQSYIDTHFKLEKDTTFLQNSINELDEMYIILKDITVDFILKKNDSIKYQRKTKGMNSHKNHACPNYYK